MSRSLSLPRLVKLPDQNSQFHRVVGVEVDELEAGEIGVGIQAAGVELYANIFVPVVDGQLVVVAVAGKVVSRLHHEAAARQLAGQSHLLSAAVQHLDLAA